MASTPSTPFPSIGVPVAASSTTGLTPKNGTVAEPGLVGIAPGCGVIIWPPVSVCHQVSTIGQRCLPTWVSYQTHASGLIGSPTVPSRRRLDRSCLSTHSGPCPISVRSAVGAA